MSALNNNKKEATVAIIWAHVGVNWNSLNNICVHNEFCDIPFVERSNHKDSKDLDGFPPHRPGWEYY